MISCCFLVKQDVFLVQCYSLCMDCSKAKFGCHHAGIVKLLIEGAAELGLVPREVEVAAANVRLQYGVMETRSLDNMLQSSDDPLPSHPGSRKPSISGP